MQLGLLRLARAKRRLLPVKLSRLRARERLAPLLATGLRLQLGYERTLVRIFRLSLMSVKPQEPLLVLGRLLLFKDFPVKESEASQVQAIRQQQCFNVLVHRR